MDLTRGGDALFSARWNLSSSTANDADMSHMSTSILYATRALSHVLLLLFLETCCCASFKCPYH